MNGLPRLGARLRWFLREVWWSLDATRHFSWHSWRLTLWALREAWVCVRRGHQLHFHDTDADGWYVDRWGECLSRSCSRCNFHEARDLDGRELDDDDPA